MILGLAEQETNRWLIIGAFELRVDRRKVEVELSRVLRLERGGFELDDDVALQTRVVEKQIDEELVAADLDAMLTAYEREASAEFEKESCNVPHESVLDVVLLGFIANSQEIEVIWVF